jgi:hypothetical protein
MYKPQNASKPGIFTCNRLILTIEFRLSGCVFVTSCTTGERSIRNSSDSKLQKSLLRKHHLHAGLYVRVARRLGLHQSYVSKVAHGKVNSLKVSRALLDDLRRIERIGARAFSFPSHAALNQTEIRAFFGSTSFMQGSMPVLLDKWE